MLSCKSCWSVGIIVLISCAWPDFVLALGDMTRHLDFSFKNWGTTREKNMSFGYHLKMSTPKLPEWVSEDWKEVPETIIEHLSEKIHITNTLNCTDSAEMTKDHRWCWAQKWSTRIVQWLWTGFMMTLSNFWTKFSFLYILRVIIFKSMSQES
jgi:hypothetical protein